VKKIFPADHIPTLTHVAIIPDGNGRWAKQQGLRRNQGHKQGVENVGNIVEYARELGIKYLTFYAFSAENWDRPQGEVVALMKMLEHFLKTKLCYFPVWSTPTPEASVPPQINRTHPY